MIVIAIDPGPGESALVVLEDGKITKHWKAKNEALRTFLVQNHCGSLVIEWIQGYGLAVGQTVFDTCRWVGRFEEVWKRWDGDEVHLMGRKEIKAHLCNNVSAKDQHVREALIDRFGEPGTKKSPGPTYGISGDEWAALAVAVTWMDKYGGKE